MSKSHVLTISIPTYNRSKFLMETLGNIRDQMTNDCLEDDIAIHVNDNCSPDSTGNDVALFRKNNPKIKMTYARNKSNLGADRNIDLAAKAAKTPWTWLMGDDDRIVEGSLKFVIDKIQSLAHDVSFMTMKVDIYNRELSTLLVKDNTFKGELIERGVTPYSARLYIRFMFLVKHIFRTEKWIQTKYLKNYMGSEMIQLYFFLYWVHKNEKVAFFDRVCIHYRANNYALSEESAYKLTTAFVENCPELIEEIFKEEKMRKIMLMGAFQNFAILSFKKTESNSILPSKRSWILFEKARKYYSFMPKFWIFYSIQLFVPPVLARLLKKAYDDYRGGLNYLFRNK